MSYIWNRFQGRNTHRDINIQGSDFKNARSPYVTATEGAPTADVNKIMLPLFGVFDDDDGQTQQAGNYGATIFGALALQIEDELPPTTTIVDEDYLPPTIAAAAQTGNLSLVEDDILEVHVEEDSATEQRSVPPKLFLVTKNDVDEDLISFVIEEADNNAVNVSRSSVVDNNLNTEDDISFVIEDADNNALVASRTGTANVVVNTEDDISFVVEESDDDTRVSPRVVTANDISSNNEEEALTPSLEDADISTQPYLRLVPAPATSDADADDLPIVPPPPTPPQTRFVSVVTGGGAVGDEEIEPEKATFRVLATHLDVLVYASMLPVHVVERGNLVILVAQFTGDPAEVFFSYMKPGEQRPHVDPGFGQRDSRIRRTGEGVYTYVIDTEGFSAGNIQWHFWGTGEHQASGFGKVEIPPRPAQLL